MSNNLDTSFNGATDFVVDDRRISPCDVVGVVGVALSDDVFCRRELPLSVDFASQRLVLGFKLKAKKVSMSKKDNGRL